MNRAILLGFLGIIFNLVQAAEACDTDNYEPNNSCAEAYDLSNREGKWLSEIEGLACECGYDFFKINVSENYEKVIVKLMFDWSVGEVAFPGILDSSCNYFSRPSSQLSAVYTQQSWGTEAVFLFPEHGTYYIQPTGGQPFTYSTYDLWWDDLKPNILEISPTEQIVSPSADSTTFKVKNAGMGSMFWQSSKPFRYDHIGSWTPKSGTLGPNKEISITVYYYENYDVTTTESQIEIQAKDGEGSPKYFTLKQLGRELRVTSPNGGEVWSGGKTYNITWSSSGDVGSQVTLKLYKKDILQQYIPVSTEVVTNDGTFAWTVPKSLAEGSDYKIVVQSPTNTHVGDESDAYFTISQGGEPELHMTSPNGSEVWSGGKTYNITWNSNGDVGSQVTLNLYKNDEWKQWIPSGTELVANNGTFAWTVPKNLAQGSDYKIGVQSHTDTQVGDVSNAYFTILQGGGDATGSLKVTIEPSGARSAGAQWRVDSGSWHNSDYTQSNISEGSHTLSFKDVSGWNKPGTKSVTITAGKTTTATGTYTEIPSSPVLSVSPSSQSVSYSSGDTSFNVSNSGDGTLNWSASVITGNWLRITSGTSGKNSGTISVTYDYNSSTSSRTGEIKVTASGASGSPKTVTVKQDRKPYSPPSTSNNSGCFKSLTTNSLEQIKKQFADWLVMGLSMIVLLSLSRIR